jgi:hypothetical protein
VEPREVETGADIHVATDSSGINHRRPKELDALRKIIIIRFGCDCGQAALSVSSLTGTSMLPESLWM